MSSEVYMGLSDIIDEMEALSYEGGFPVLNSKSMWELIGGDKFLVKKVLRLYDVNPDQFMTSFMLKMLGWYLRKNGTGDTCLSCYFCGGTRLLSELSLTPEDKHDLTVESATPSERLFDPV